MDYEVSARRDVRWWVLLAFGVFVFLKTEPADAIVHWSGAAIALFATMRLLFNPRRGSQIDPRTGYLVWWKKRYAVSDGKAGRIHPSRIDCIRILRRPDGEDGVELYDLDGVRQEHFDGEVIPEPYLDWARKFAERWPHVRVETK